MAGWGTIMRKQKKGQPHVLTFGIFIAQKRHS
jgi:hypothetical protein